MKATLTFLFSCLISMHLTAQQKSNYQHDLEFLYQTLQKTPGYKDQIKGNRTQQYQELYAQLYQAKIKPSVLDTFYTFSKLLWPIKDMHLGFQQVWDQSVSIKQLQDSNYIENYRSKDTFKNFPRTSLNLDSLEKILLRKPADSIEGIYQVNHLGKVGIYRTHKTDSLVGIILSTNYQNSAAGQLFGILNEMAPGRFRAVYADLFTRSFVYARDVGFRQGMFTQLNMRKVGVSILAELWSQEPYTFKTIASNYQYIHLGTFQSSYSSLKKAKAFHELIKDSLTAAHLIVDLRGNSGGGEKSSAQFLKLIKKYAEKGQVYVLVNRFVMSNAERFTLALQKIKGIKVYGETTAGIIAYGKNTDEVAVLPSGRFRVYNTDMKDPAGYLKYEEIGIKPDVYLNNNSDWIRQVISLSKKEK